MIKLLKVGGKGEDVRRVQARLKELGFNPGRMDGAFGAATEAAVRAFQNRAELLADGIVGPSTFKALLKTICSPLEIRPTKILQPVWLP